MKFNRTLTMMGVLILSLLLAPTVLLAEPFSPGDLEPALWLDGKNATTVTLAADVVERWSDKSDNNHDAAQSNQDWRPRYNSGDGVLSFTIESINDKEIGDILDVDKIQYGGEEITLYAVANPAPFTASENRWIVSKGPYGSSAGYSLLQRGNDDGGVFGAIVAGATAYGSKTDGQLHLLGQIVKDRKNHLLVDGRLFDRPAIPDDDMTKALNNTKNLGIGAAMKGEEVYRPFAGSIGEVLVFQRALSDMERALLEGWLAEKWGLRVKLPEGHPFREKEHGAFAPDELTVAENAANGSEFGSLQGAGLGDHTFTDWRIEETMTKYKGMFSISAARGLHVADNTDLDYEKTRSHVIKVSVLDSKTGVRSEGTEIRIDVEDDPNDEPKKSASLLWGSNGETWDPRGRLPDYSYAGYHAGDGSIPDVEQLVDATKKTCDEKGEKICEQLKDGSINASDAINAAIVEASEIINSSSEITAGAVYLPKGIYKLETPVIIKKSGIVIRGAVDASGALTTILDCPNSAESVLDPPEGDPDPADLLEWDMKEGDNYFSGEAGQMIRFAGDPPGDNDIFATVKEDAKRGDRTLKVEGVSDIDHTGPVVLEMTDESRLGPLWKHIHNKQDEPFENPCTWAKGDGKWMFWVESIQGDEITLREPLPFDVPRTWETGDPPTRFSRLLYFNGLKNVGVENLRFTFAVPDQLPKHLEEPGYNGVGFSNVADGWARNLVFENSDNGVTVQNQSAWVTVKDITLSGRRGHHGVSFNASQHCLASGITFNVDEGSDPWLHGFTMTHKTLRCVAEKLSSGPNPHTIKLDYHRNGPMENLFTEIQTAWSYHSGGNACAGPHAAARNTYWNLPGAPGDVENKPVDNWGYIQTNLVGALSVPDRMTTDREWYENVDGLQPENLYTAQLAWRRANENFSNEAALVPDAAAADVDVDATLKILFNQTVQKGPTGRIVIKKTSDDSVVHVFDVTDAAVTVIGQTVSIDPPADLAPGTDYYILVEYGAIKNATGNLFTGLDYKEAWNFTTAGN